MNYNIVNNINLVQLNADELSKVFHNDAIVQELNNANLLISYYELGSSEGEIFVLYEKMGELYEVNASHCSWFGFENQWKPTVTTWENLSIRDFNNFAEDMEYNQALLIFLKKMYSCKNGL